MDEITEVILVEEDDLEEGEITDDGESETKVTMSPKPKKRKLPKRYTLNEKHKKECKHTRYSNHKVKNKEKTFALNSSYKKHKSSCLLQRQKSSMAKLDSVKHVPPTNHTKSFSNHNSTLKSAFKNYTSPPRPVLKYQKSSSNCPQYFEKEDNFSDLLLAYKKRQEQQNHKRKLSDFDEPSSSKKSTKQSPMPKSDEKITLIKNEENHYVKCEKVSPIKKEAKQYVKNEKHSPLKKEAKQSLGEQISTIKNGTAIFLDESTHEYQPMLTQTEEETYPLFEERKDEEESEDEEELRRIALATCVKRTMARQKASKNLNSSTNNSPGHTVSNPSSVTMLINNDNCSSNNYDVVDMDLDDEDFIKDVNENLFVIDNNPVMSSEFQQDLFHCEPYLCYNSEPTANYLLPPEQEMNFQSSQTNSNQNFQECLSSSHIQSNQDFEEALLRAELIASLNAKKVAQAIPKAASCVPAKFPELTNRTKYASYQGQIHKPPAGSKRQLLQSVTASVKRSDVVKLNNSKLPNTKKVTAPKPRNINATQERLIITLNNDSSSDESDEADESNETIKQENVGSIDALISNARQKSDIKANGASLNHVSCLSKAQQEEYKKLRNLLAEKEPMTIIPLAVKDKSSAEHQNLNFLTNKISVAKEKLDKEMEVLFNTEHEVLNKKKNYISSKLKFQQLQEQLQAAKLSKTTNLKAWKVCEAKLVNAKSAVSKQKTLIALLETEFNNRRLQFDQNSSSPLIQ